MTVPSNECQGTIIDGKPTMIQVHWLSVTRQQTITRAIVDPDLCHHMSSLGHI